GEVADLQVGSQDGHGDGGRGAAAAAVGDGVAERIRPREAGGGSVGHGLTVGGDGDAAGGANGRHTLDGQRVAIGVRVVGQDRDGDRGAGQRRGRVIDGDGGVGGGGSLGGQHQVGGGVHRPQRERGRQPRGVDGGRGDG